MKRLNYGCLFAAVLGLLCLGGTVGMAQQGPGGGGGGRNFDPEQMRQRMMERYREQLDVKDDAEWKLISERIEKVTEAQREARFGGMMGFGGRGGRRGGPGGPGGPPPAATTDGAAPAAPAAADATRPAEDRRPPGGPPGFGRFGDNSPEAEDLQKAIEAKASGDELKAKLAKLRESRKAKEAKLEKAQDDLRQVLSVRQEAAAVLAGLLK